MSSKQTPEPDPTIANRFLAHQLSDAERVMLEAELVVDPATVQELEATARLKIGLHRLRERGELDALLAPPVRRSRAPVMAALAASVAAVAVLLGRMVITSTPELLTTFDASRGTDTAADTYQSHVLLRLRGPANATIIRLPADGRAIKLDILPTDELTPPIRVALLAAGSSDKPLSEVTVRAPNADNYVVVLVDSTQLQPGSYQLVISSLGDPTQDNEQFLLEIEPAPQQ